MKGNNQKEKYDFKSQRVVLDNKNAENFIQMKLFVGKLQKRLNSNA
jgi:hypothetical protein